jgi:tRNA nucleotidyltransferase (CCA-adding enzyme)
VSPDPDPRVRIERLLATAPWLRETSRQATVAGSAALAVACAEAGLPGPDVRDIDIAWALPPGQAAAEFDRLGIAHSATEGSRSRGTIGAVIHGERVEFTTWRRHHGRSGSGDERFFVGGSTADSVAMDARSRDMTIGAVFVDLASGAVLDPAGGLRDWSERLIKPVGDFMERVAEHPVRLLRYFRRAVELRFHFDRSIRDGAAAAAPLTRDHTPPEAVADEVRKVLVRCASPGLFFLYLAESRALRVLFPELAPQFDGRPAGPAIHHPEVSQGLHLCLALKRAAEKAWERRLPDLDRVALLTAVLCHDLGKGETGPELLPRHHGHEARGTHLVESLLARLPGLADGPARRLAISVAEEHGKMREFRSLRPGTLVDLWDEHFRRPGFRADLFAAAVASDREGRLPHEILGVPFATDDGPGEREMVELIAGVDAACRSVDAEAIRAKSGEDVALLKERLRLARCTALRGAGLARGEG